MKNLKGNIYLKLTIIFIIVLILLIPTSMFKGLIRERENIQLGAIDEVSSKWARAQNITGPFLAVPYDKFIKQVSSDKTTHEFVKVTDWIYFLPEELIINGKVSPEKRYRGIYEIVVYDSSLNISGNFKPINFDQFQIDQKYIHLDKARLNIGISDLKGIEKQININWNGSELLFDSGISSNQIATSGINTITPIIPNENKSYKFSLNIDLKGSQSLYFSPIGKTTDINLTSTWPSPSFKGNYLPDKRTISEDGFSANWNILHLNRNYPQSWVGNKYDVQSSSFGTELLLPVDNYKKSDRVTKYAMLFIVLTFMVFFFVEVLNKVFIHPVQYLLVGAALVIFYILLLSFSEHINFNFAYVISSFLTLSLITAYTSTILKSKKIAGLIFGILTIMYSFIYTIILIGDYALLTGSIGIFLILGLVMYFSRKIDWYRVSIGDTIKNEPSLSK